MFWKLSPFGHIVCKYFLIFHIASFPLPCKSSKVWFDHFPLFLCFISIALGNWPSLPVEEPLGILSQELSPMKCTLWCHLSPIVLAHKVHGWLLTLPSDPSLPGKCRWLHWASFRQCAHKVASADSSVQILCSQALIGTAIVVHLHLLWGLWNHFRPSPASACAHPQSLQLLPWDPLQLWEH